MPRIPVARSPLDIGERPPAMHDVALLAGVSHQTVSRVLNDHPNVKPETRQRVQTAIAELGYRRNIAARTLVTRRTDIIGIITNSSPLFGPSSTLLAVERAARDAGYFVSVASMRVPDRAGLEKSLDHFLSQSVDGVVVIAPQDSGAEAVSALAGRLPIVVIAADDPDLPNMRTVAVDQVAGARLAVGHLAELGHRRIAHVSGPLDWYEARSRIQGWREALDEAGLRPGRLIHGDWTPARGYRIGLDLIAEGLPDAVFAGNDEMALGMLHAFRQHGISAPADISVVGFDDVTTAAYYSPPLTTVRQDFIALGELALAQLKTMLVGGHHDDQRRSIMPELIVRESTRAASGTTRRGRRSPPVRAALAAESG